jgi:hypothetical protein
VLELFPDLENIARVLCAAGLCGAGEIALRIRYVAAIGRTAIASAIEGVESPEMCGMSGRRERSQGADRKKFGAHANTTEHDAYTSRETGAAF